MAIWKVAKPAAAFRRNTYVQVVYTRDAATGLFKGYLNGVLQGQGTDANGDFVIDGSNVLSFFQDDLAVPNEASAGSIARLRLYDVPLSGRRSRRDESSTLLQGRLHRKAQNSLGDLFLLPSRLSTSTAMARVIWR